VYGILLLAATLFILPVNAKKSRYPKVKKDTHKTPMPKLNTDLVPAFDDILAELNIQHRRDSLIKMGITETRNLLRLTRMDYQMMLIEWGDEAETEIERLKTRAVELLAIATVPDDVKDDVVDERAKHRTGRVYFPGFVQSFEYMSASFGVVPPKGPHDLVMASPLDGCSAPSDPSVYTNKMVLTVRGECTFLEKSRIAKANGAAVLAIVNTEDKVEAVASGLGIDESVTPSMVEPIQDFAVITLANTSLAPLLTSAENGPLIAHAVPLKCGKGGKCLPLLEEEKAFQTEITWGRARLDLSAGNTLECDFLTSTYGGLLPISAMPVSDLASLADPSAGDACIGGLSSINAKGGALLVPRGGCRFDEKALAVQETGARLMVVYDTDDNAMQRLGGLHPVMGYVGIPSVMIPLPCAEKVKASISSGNRAELTLTPSSDSSGHDDWIDVAYMQWEEADDNRLLQLEGLMNKYSKASTDIVDWFDRVSKRIQEKLSGGSNKGEL